MNFFYHLRLNDSLRPLQKKKKIKYVKFGHNLDFLPPFILDSSHDLHMIIFLGEKTKKVKFHLFNDK